MQKGKRAWFWHVASHDIVVQTFTKKIYLEKVRIIAKVESTICFRFRSQAHESILLAVEVTFPLACLVAPLEKKFTVKPYILMAI